MKRPRHVEPVAPAVVVEPDVKPAAAIPEQSALFGQRMDDLRDHIRISPTALEELGGSMDLEWREDNGGIEAMRGEQQIRVTRDDIIITHTRFGGTKTIPLR